MPGHWRVCLCLSALWWSTWLQGPLWWDQLWYEISTFGLSIFSFLMCHATSLIFLLEWLSLIKWFTCPSFCFLYLFLSLLISFSSHSYTQAQLQLGAFQGYRTRPASQGAQVSTVTLQLVFQVSIPLDPRVACLVWLAQKSQENLNFIRLHPQVQVYQVFIR